MVGKNNRRITEEKCNNKQNHYGIRKLSIGVASVLLGTTIFFGTSTVAHADTTTVKDAYSKTDDVNNKLTAQQVSLSDQSQVTSDSVMANSSSKANLSMSASDNSTIIANSTASTSEVIADSSANNVAQSSETTASFANSPVATSAASSAPVFEHGVSIPTNQNGNENAKLVGTGKAESVTLEDDSSLESQFDVVDSTNNSTTLTFKSGSFKPGDEYTIKIPTAGGLNLTEQDVAKLQSSFGTTSFTFSGDNDYYIITDRFTNTGSISQSIKVSFADDNKLQFGSYFKIENAIELSKNNMQTVTLPIKSISRKMSLYENGETLGSDSAQNEINLDDLSKPVLVNDHDISSTLKINVGVSSYNFSITHKNYNSVLTGLNIHLDRSAVPAGLTISSISYTDPQTGKTVIRQFDQNGNVEFSADEVQALGTESQGIKLTLNSRISVNADQFNHHHFDLPETTGTITISATDKNNYTYNVPLKIKQATVTDDISSIWMGDLTIGALGFTAGYLDNDYSASVDANSVIVINDHVNDTSISSENDLAKAILNRSGTYLLTNANLHNFVDTITIPDGLDVRSNDGDQSAITITTGKGNISENDYVLVTYNDNSVVKVAPSKDGSKSQFVLPIVDKSIKTIAVHFSSISDDLIKVQAGSKTTAKFNSTYADGSPVQINDVLQLMVLLEANGIKTAGGAYNYIRVIDHNQGIKKGIFNATVNRQSNKTPGVVNAGSLYYETRDSAYGYPQYKRPIMYIQVPANAVITGNIADAVKIDASFNSASKLTPKSISLLRINDSTFIKIDLSNYNYLKAGFNVSVNYSNLPDIQTSTEPTAFLVVADNLNDSSIDQLSRYTNTSESNVTVKANIDQLIQQENIDPNYTSYHGTTVGYSANWNILTADGISPMTMVSSNENPTLSLSGLQNDHTANADTFNMYGTIVNATDKAIAGATQIINIPNTSDGQSQFNPVLTGPITVINATNHEDLSSLVTITYSMQPASLTGTTLISNPLTADQVTDWSKIKSVMIQFNKPLPKRASARAVLTLKDSQIYDHIGKTIYASNVIFANDINEQLKPVSIMPGSPASAKLTVDGQSTVTTWIHYQNANGQDQYVQLPDQTKVYHELTDTMNRSDFISSDQDLSATDKALLPNNLLINWDAEPTIENSDNTYIDGYQNGIAEFGKPVQYDFDGDRVVYEGALVKNVNQNRVITRTIHYQYADGSTAKPNVVQTSKTFSNVGFENPFTHQITWADTTDSDTLAKVVSPVINGYTADQLSVDSLEVNFNSSNSEVTVVYSPNEQKMTIKYIDDTTGKVLNTVTKTGLSDESANYNTKSDIEKYQGLHYVLVSDNTNGENLVFDHDDSQDQTYTVHLVHQTSNVSRQSTVNEIIHYIYANGQSAHDDYQATPIVFTQTGVKDNVTGEIAWNNVNEQQFNKVTSPIIKGYTPDQSIIDAQIVKFGDPNVIKTVMYNADQQKLTVTFIDDITGKVLNTVTKTGLSDKSANYNTKNQIANYVSQGYSLVSDNTNGQNLLFDHDDAQDQSYEVHLTHHFENVSRTSEVHETIKYVYAEGQVQAAPDYQAQAIKFIQKGVKDDVTNIIDWQPVEQQMFSEVQSPVINGYTADQTKVSVVVVNFGDQDIVKTVSYSANVQNLDVTFIDDTTGKALATFTKSGLSDSSVNYNTRNDIKNYEKQHYVLVSDDTNGQDLIFVHNDQQDQHYKIHLVHATSPINEEHTVNEVIHYVYNNGTTAHADYNAPTINFSRTGTKDLVTNNIDWNAWTPAEQSFDQVTTPAINGYTPNIEIVSSVSVSHNSKDVEQTVTYHADDQTILVNYIDDDSHSILKTDTIVGKTAQKSDYNTKKSIDDYIVNHYELVSDDTNGKTLIFDSDSNNAQVYNVHFKHVHQNVSDLAIINETIHYVYIDGSKVTNDYHAPAINFKRTGTKDLVTNSIIWNAWIPESQDFKAVDSPAINGYIPSQKTINAINVQPCDKAIDQTVVYAPNNQSMVVNYIDNVTGKTLKTDVLTGESDQTSDYSTKNTINSYEKQHYVLVSDDTQGETLIFDHDDQVTQVYNVHLSHQTELASQSRTVNETINYVYADGSKVADTFTAKPLTFTQTGVKDLVTDDINWNGVWTPKQTFNEVTSPEIIGYTASQQAIDSITVDHNSADVHQIVIYTANNQTAKIKYIDDAIGKTLETDSINGKFGEQIKFDHSVNDQIKNFENQGYKFKSNNFNSQKYQADDSQNEFEVHFTHGTQNVSQTDQVTETIKYQFEDGRQAQNDHVQTAEFIQYGVQDLVTKTVVWIPSVSQSFESVTVPVITGYTANMQTIPAVPVNFGDQDQIIIVIYNANDQLAGIKYVDDTTGETLDTEATSGKFGTRIEFMTDPSAMIQKFENQGYELISNNFDTQDYQADNSKNQFEVHFKHVMKDISRTSTVTRIIKWVDQITGTEIHKPVIQTLTFTEAGVTDLVTGETSWTIPSDQYFEKVESPNIDGYENPDIPLVNSETAKFGNSDQTVTVNYHKTEVPSTPNTPDISSTLDVPDTPTISNTSEIPTTLANKVTQTTQVIKQNSSDKRLQTSDQRAVKNTDKKQLPQTGNQDNRQLGLVGLASVAFAGLIGFGKKKRHE